VHSRQHKEEVVKRKGFTLIELMVVIAIIIILAAIAIPNYLKMTERAKKSRVAADFGALALALESYKTDWGVYPLIADNAFGAVADVALVSGTGSTFGLEISGKKAIAGTAELPNGNAAADVTATGEKGPIEYMKPGTIVSMSNPFQKSYDYHYIGSAITWTLYAQMSATDYLARSETITVLAQISGVPTTAGSVTPGT
jgi:type IV pilus assembly protein PilA